SRRYRILETFCLCNQSRRRYITMVIHVQHDYIVRIAAAVKPIAPAMQRPSIIERGEDTAGPTPGQGHGLGAHAIVPPRKTVQQIGINVTREVARPIECKMPTLS